MKTRIAYIVGLLAAAAALVGSEMRQVDAEVAPTAVMYFVADAQHELTRLPVRFTRISDAEEIRTGEELAKFYGSGFGEQEFRGDDKEMAEYVAAVGAKLQPHAGRKLPYKFYFVADRSFVNAFALPGGPVFIGSGLIEQFDSEDQLAAILAHEIEHVDHYHCVERLQVEAALRKVPFGSLLALPAELFQAGYTKEQELEADVEGMKLAARAGYSPEGAVRVQTTFARLREGAHERARSPGRELSETAKSILVEYFRTHPEPEDRRAHLLAAIAREPWLQGRTERALEVTRIILARRASDAVGQKHYASAAVLARRALALRPQHTGALTALAQAAFALRRFDEAVPAYHAAIKQEPRAGAEVRTAAEIAASDLIAEQKPQQAIEILEQLLKLQPGQPALTASLAHAQALADDYPGAATSAAQLLRLYPEDAESFARRIMERARTAFAAHDFRSATAAAWVAIHASPSWIEPRTLFADARFAQARFRESADEIAKVLQAREVSDAAPLRILADALASADRGRAFKTFEALHAKLKYDNQSVAAQARCELAGLRLMAGDATGVAAFAQEAELGKEPPELLVRIAWWRMRAGDAAGAADLLQHTIRIRPGDIAAENLLAWTEMELDQLEAARQRFQELCGECSQDLPLAPLWNTPELGRVIALWRLGKTEEALKLYPAAVARSPQWRDQPWRDALQPRKSAQAFADLATEHDRRHTEAINRMRSLHARRP